jgi:alpha-tubulin suppressor-like RCC1 family protein
VINRQYLASLIGVAILWQTATVTAQSVTQTTGGGYHSLFLEDNGSLWSMGRNNYGQLGCGTNASTGTNQPQQIVGSNVTSIAAGINHSLFLKNDGSLWSMGANGNGQLGDLTYIPTTTNQPKQIVASNVTSIAAGGYHSLFLKNDGSLWTMGANYYGQLGNGTFSTNAPTGTNQPQQIVASNVTSIAAGEDHSLLLKNDGSLWSMGENINGQLGDGTTTNSNQPKQIISSNVTAIAAGARHSLFLKNDGSLWAMGFNDFGQLGDGTTTNSNQPRQIISSNVTAIAAGGYHSLFLKNDGSLWVMGRNEEGQLGNGTNGIGVQNNYPEQIVASGVTAMEGGLYHSLFVKSNGSLWVMGWNQYGQLGDQTNISTNRPKQIVAGIAAGFNHITVQLLSGGDVRLSYVGLAGSNYALDRAFSLSPADWTPQSTNPADTAGMLVLTNSPNPATNNFWRIRSVP